ncbi:MAG: L-threonylcarbamoyladenylate synthase [Thermoproteota archaeon]|nr:L-threonylcarbamoyladenylate synthase [Thermoproteota archaeon]
MVFYFGCNKIEDLKKCASLIDNGSIIIFPTDTVYGIGCDPLNDDSVLKLFKIKNRPLDKHLPVLTSNISHLSQFVEITEEANTLINHFWPGQLTIILKLQNNSLTSRYAFDKTIAIRIPNNMCTTKLIQMTKNKLLVGTSANLSKHPPVTNVKDLETCNLQGYDAIVDGGRASASNSSSHVSTIVDLVEINNPKIIREGIISKERIFAILKENLQEKERKK